MQNRYTGDVGDFAKYGLMRQFNDAGFRMALYEQKQIDWNGTKRFFKGMAADPTTYVDLSTLGLGAIKGISQASDQGRDCCGPQSRTSNHGSRRHRGRGVYFIR